MKPYAASAPSAAELNRLVNTEGLTQAEVAARFHVSYQTVQYWLRRDRIVIKRRGRVFSHRRMIPWRVAIEHSTHPIVRLLRAHSTMTQGGRVAPDMERRVRDFLAYLAKHQLVVDYSREEGFFYRPRDDNDAPDDIVRRPR